MDRLESAKQELRFRLLSDDRVVGISKRYENGSGRLVVYVKQPGDIDTLRQDGLLLQRVHSFPVEPIVVGQPKMAVEATTSNGHTLFPGASIGLPDGGTGTLGGFVEDDYFTYILTNNHVAAESNMAKMGSSVIHPGPADASSGEVIGRLSRFQPIIPGERNIIDAALVKIPDGTVKKNDVYRTRLAGAQEKWFVQKTGRTTGHTTGYIVSMSDDVKIWMGEELGNVLFENQIATTAMLEPGDSGSVLLTRGGLPCGLSFAGSEKISFHNPITEVTSMLGVRFI